MRSSKSATSPVPGDIEVLGKAGDEGLPGRVLTLSDDGRHIYVLGADQQGHPVLYVFSRNGRSLSPAATSFSSLAWPMR